MELFRNGLMRQGKDASGGGVDGVAQFDTGTGVNERGNREAAAAAASEHNGCSIAIFAKWTTTSHRSLARRRKSEKYNGHEGLCRSGWLMF